jgi:hypothetical protein
MIAMLGLWVFKIAMVLSAAESDNLLITAEHLAKAEEILTMTEKNALHKIFDNIGKIPSARVLDRLIDLLRRTPIVARAAINRDLARIAEPRVINDIIMFAINSNIIKAAQQGNIICLARGSAYPTEEEEDAIRKTN